MFRLLREHTAGAVWFTPDSWSPAITEPGTFIATSSLLLRQECEEGSKCGLAKAIEVLSRVCTGKLPVSSAVLVRGKGRLPGAHNTSSEGQGQAGSVG